MLLFATVRRWRPAAFQLYLGAAVPGVLLAAVQLEVVGAIGGLVVLGLPALLLHRLTPDRRLLLTGGHVSPVLAVLALAAAVPLGRYAWAQLALQRAMPSGEVHAALQHWSGMAVFATTMVVLALIIARRPAGWCAGAVATGVMISLFGLGSLALSPVPSGLGVLGGWIATIGGLCFVVAAFVSARVGRPGSPELRARPELVQRPAS